MKRMFALISAVTIIMTLSACSTMSSLGRAAKAGDKKRVEELLNEGANVNDVVTPGLSPLHEAVFNNAPLEIVRLMLDRGADVNKSSCGDGWAADCNCGTALYIAVCKGNVKMVKLLLDYGADVTIVDFYKQTPLMVAQEHGQKGIARMLKEAEEKQFKNDYEGGNKDVVASDQKPAAAFGKQDIELLPSVKAKPNRNAYAIVIGIEGYRENLPKAEFAADDARLVSEYLHNSLGVPEENLVILTDGKATKSDMEKYFQRWLPNNVTKDSEVFIYYSGHGAPNPSGDDAYLVPYDGDPTYITETGYSLKRLYEILGRLNVKRNVVILDSCFSGAGNRSVIAKGMRPLVVMAADQNSVGLNTAVLSASAGNQVSSTYLDKRHGLLTYFFLKGLKEEPVVSQEGLDIHKVYNYVKQNVERIARKQYNNEQTPQLIGGKK